MELNDHDAREIARRWGQAAGAQELLDFADSGLIENRKRLADAIDSIRGLVKNPVELDSLLGFIRQPAAYELAARQAGWCVEDHLICHVHDHERSVCYKSWRDCCEGEDIDVEAGPSAATSRRRRS
jgi:hypothetical protein